jgi:hypothetical protein
VGKGVADIIMTNEVKTMFKDGPSRSSALPLVLGFLALSWCSCGPDNRSPSAGPLEAGENTASPTGLRYACIVSGAPVHAGPERTSARLFDLAFGEAVTPGGAPDSAGKDPAEVWVAVKRGAASGWIPAWQLTSKPPRKEDYLEQPATVEGAWQAVIGEHVYQIAFEAGGQCTVECLNCVTGTDDGAGPPEYRWREEGGTIVVTAFGAGSPPDGETAFRWEIRERTRFHMLIDDQSAVQDFFRPSLIARAVKAGSLDYLRALFANNRYAPADFINHLERDPYYDETRDPVLKELRQTAASWEAAREERMAQAAAGGPPFLEGPEPPDPVTSGRPTILEWIDLPLLGLALSGDRPQEDVARFLIRQKADVNAPVKKFWNYEDEETVNEPLPVYLKKHGAVPGYRLLLESGAGASNPEAAGEDGSVKQVVPAEGLNLRDAPAVNGKIIGLIPRGGAVTVLGETGDEVKLLGRTGRWTRVRWEGKTGWVFGGLLE